MSTFSSFQAKWIFRFKPLFQTVVQAKVNFLNVVQSFHLLKFHLAIWFGYLIKVRSRVTETDRHLVWVRVNLVLKFFQTALRVARIRLVERAIVLKLKKRFVNSQKHFKINLYRYRISTDSSDN